MNVPLDLLESFKPLIIGWDELEFMESRAGVMMKLKIEFSDHSVLYTFDATFTDSSNQRYGYHWMTVDKQTLFRWDNTPHFPSFDTFPFHRHTGPGEVAEPFPKVTLEDVLLFIAAQLTAD